MDYSPLEKLAKQIEEQVSMLKSGHMNASELHGLVKTSREVYERLVILEFQALEKKAELNDARPITTPFKIETEEIEESPNGEDKESSEVLLDETLSTTEKNDVNETENPELETPKVETPVINLVEKEPIPELEGEVSEVPGTKSEESTGAPTNIEPATQKKEKQAPVEETGSSLEKYEQAPIEDIAKAISLNEKFQFIRVLCSNDAKSFESLLANINNCENEEKALSTFATLIPKPEAEDALEVYEKFRELIKRRF